MDQETVSISNGSGVWCVGVCGRSVMVFIKHLRADLSPFKAQTWKMNQDYLSAWHTGGLLTRTDSLISLSDLITAPRP